MYDDVIKHTLFDCIALGNYRLPFSVSLDIKLGQAVCDYVSSLNSNKQLGVLLDGPFT